ncbi:uncharacterized protein [Scyliorhinus torazame]|uniref:uncharacterized protein n=1 Tax=Scyliorhinus torazame TaxID=75743 RepID=UPI003B59857A
MVLKKETQKHSSLGQDQNVCVWLVSPPEHHSHLFSVSLLQEADDKTFPIKPLTYKLPPDLSNKSISKGIAASESNAFSLPSSTQKRPIPSFYTQRNRRSESTERSPLSWTKQCKLPRNGKTGRIHGKRRSAAVSSEKRSYNSQNSTEENVITKTFLASLPRMKHLQKEQANPYNFKVEILQRDLSKETTKTAPDSNVYSREPTSSSNYTTLVKNEALKDGDTVRSTCCRWEVKENEIVSSGSERFQVKNMQDSSAGGSLAAPCSIANHMDMKKPGISNETVKGIVTCFRNLLSHFIPPNYHISKEKVNLLTAEELVIFPLHHYFFHYEKSLRERFQSSSENVITRAQEVEVEQKMHQAVAKLEDTKEKLKCSQNVFVQLLNKPITLQSEESKLLEELVKSFEKDAKSSNVVSD